jgi:hypothetical protein
MKIQYPVVSALVLWHLRTQDMAALGDTLLQLSSPTSTDAEE